LFGCIFVPLGVLWVAMKLVFGGGSRNVTVGEIAADYVGRLILPAFLASFAIGAAAVLLVNLITGEKPLLGPALKATMARFGDLLAGAVMATAIALVIGALEPGIDYLGVTMMFYGPPILVQALLIGGLSYRDAGIEARSLLGGNWLRTLGYLITIALGIGLITDIAMGFTIQLVAVLPTGSVALLVGLIRGLVLALLFPILAVASTVLYGDLRARARGLTTAKDKFIREGRRDPKEGRSTT
jgi:hypothetical protein